MKMSSTFPMTTLRNAQIQNNLEQFIKEHETEVVEKETLQRYIDASATPLDNRIKGQSKFSQGSGDGCK